MFEAGDSSDLSEKLALLIAHKEMRDRMGTHGRKKSELFDWSVVAEKILNYYLSFASILDKKKTSDIR